MEGIIKTIDSNISIPENDLLRKNVKECNKLEVDNIYIKASSVFGDGSRGKPYGTIKEAIEAVNVNGNVIVLPGVYEEKICITKSLNLLGANEGINPDSEERCDESIIIPLENDYEMGNGIEINADNVTIKGFTIDGCNSKFENGIKLNDMQVNAACGICNNDSVVGKFFNINGLTIENNIIRNFNKYGVMLCSNEGEVLKNNMIKNNFIENICFVSQNGRAICITNNAYADIVNNFITRAYIAIQTNKFYKEGKKTIITGNRIKKSNSGIWINLHHGNASNFSILNNDIDLSGDNSDRGIWFTSILNDTVMILKNNNVTGCNIGIDLWNAPTKQGGGEISEGVIRENNYGIMMSNNSENFGEGKGSILRIDNLEINSSKIKSIYMNGDDYSGDEIKLIIKDNIIVDGIDINFNNASNYIFTQGKNTDINM